MNAGHVVKAWGLILGGFQPNLSIEITRECPLRCPGCYAYGDTHLGGDVVLRQLADYKGQELVDGVLDVVARHRPLHLSIVGGEPLVRFRELETLLPKLTGMGIHTQVVTSAVRPIPESWAAMPRLQVCVSIDGLQPEHDVRRAPATYDRILKHIRGQQVTVHCTITRQQTEPGYATRFTEFWATVPEVKRIWFSLYTPQKGEQSAEMLRPEDRQRVVAEMIGAVHARAEAARHAPGDASPGYLRPPRESRRVHLRADDGVPVLGPGADDHAVSVRRRPGLHAVRLSGVGGPRCDRPAPAGRRRAASMRSSAGRWPWAAPSGGCAVRAPAGRPRGRHPRRSAASPDVIH